MKIKDRIISKCRKGDRKAQKELFSLLYSESLKVTMRYCSCEEEAKDVLAKGFFKVFRKINQFKGNGDNFFGWVKRILINQALDQIKSQSFQKSFVTLEDVEVESEIVNVESQLRSEEIILLIQKLPNTASCVFNLYAIEGYSHTEIAHMLGITATNSRYHLSAARKQLKEWIFKTEEL